MPFLHAAELAIATLFVTAATARGRLHPVLALIMASTAFAAVTGMSISQTGKTFGTGFGQTATAVGLPLLAATAIVLLANQSGAMARVQGSVQGNTMARRSLLAALGLMAGTGATPAASFAVAAPLRVALSDPGIHGQRQSAASLLLALNAGQSLLFPSPVIIAATAILGASWQRVLAFGLPLALLLAAATCRFHSNMQARSPSISDEPATARATAGLIAAPLLMLLMLSVQSIGDMPSEPLGGGAARELILGVGRPLMLLLAGTALMVAATAAWRGHALGEAGWPAQAIAATAPLAMLAATAGALQSLTQTSHMAELVAEQALALPLGLALPFLVALIMKALQGAPLVAAITTAGMIAPMLPQLGLDAPTHRALAVLAIGAGSLALPHINDPLFWLAADAAGLRPAAALRWLTAPCLLQAVTILAALLLAQAMT